MTKILSGKVAIVTGAGQGIGKATALRLAKEGAVLIVAEYNPETAKQTTSEIESLGQHAVAYPIDISSVSAIKKMAKDVVDVFGRIDILVNNAGISEVRPFFDIPKMLGKRSIVLMKKDRFSVCKRLPVRWLPKYLKRLKKQDDLNLVMEKL